MIVYIDGDNISTSKWIGIAKAFRKKYRNAIINIFKLDVGIGFQEIETSDMIGANLINVIPTTKESTDIHIIYSVATIASKFPNINHYIISNDSGFTAMPYINDNVSVLRTESLNPSKSQLRKVREAKLLKHMKSQGLHKIKKGEAGTILKPKLSGYSGMDTFIEDSKVFKLSKQWIYLL